MNTPSVPSSVDDGQLRVVIDAQLILPAFLVRRDHPGIISPRRALLSLLRKPTFRWLWSADILKDYEQGANTIQTNERLGRRYLFDFLNFQALLGSLQLSSPVSISLSTLRSARQRISQASRAAERDLEDAIYLACAVDGDAHILATEDSDLLTLGRSYEGVRIVNWKDMKEELVRRGLWE